MRMVTNGPRAGTTSGDVLIVLSILTVGAAMAYPRFHEERRQERLDEVMEAVETVRTTAMRHYAEHRDWPEPAKPGSVPPALGALLPPGLSFSRDDFTLEWRRWEAVQTPPDPVIPEVQAPELDTPPLADTIPPTPPPTVHAIAGLTVHSGDDGILGALLDRYGSGVSFVRDTTWTLMMPLRSDPVGDTVPPTG